MKEERKNELLNLFMNFIKEELCEDNEKQWFCDKFDMTKEEINEILKDKGELWKN